MPPEYCGQHNDFVEKVSGIDKTLTRVETKLDNAITNTTNHYNQSFKYRLAIVCSCIGLVGGAVGVIVKFAVMDYKVNVMGGDVSQIKEQIYDLNYIRGKAEGLNERK